MYKCYPECPFSSDSSVNVALPIYVSEDIDGQQVCVVACTTEQMFFYEEVSVGDKTVNKCVSECGTKQVFVKDSRNDHAYKCLDQCPDGAPYFDEFQGCVALCEKDMTGIRAYVNNQNIKGSKQKLFCVSQSYVRADNVCIDYGKLYLKLDSNAQYECVTTCDADVYFNANLVNPEVNALPCDSKCDALKTLYPGRDNVYECVYQCPNDLPIDNNKICQTEACANVFSRDSNTFYAK